MSKKVRFIIENGSQNRKKTSDWFEPFTLFLFQNASKRKYHVELILDTTSLNILFYDINSIDYIIYVYKIQE